MSGVTDIINTVSYVLIAFVAVSLIVSSIMIGVITYISVLERKRKLEFYAPSEPASSISQKCSMRKHSLLVFYRPDWNRDHLIAPDSD